MRLESTLRRPLTCGEGQGASRGARREPCAWRLCTWRPCAWRLCTWRPCAWRPCAWRPCAWRPCTWRPCAWRPCVWWRCAGAPSALSARFGRGVRVGPSRAGGACYRLHVQCEADPVGGCYVSGGLEEWASLADGTREARLVGRAELEQPRVQLRERLLLRAHVRRQRLEGLPKPVDSVRADLRAASHEKAEAAGRGRQLRRDGRVRREWELAVGSEQRRDCLRLPEQRLGPSRRLELLRAEKDGTERRPHRGGRRQRHLTQRKRDGRTRHIERAEHGRVQLRRCRVERLVQHAKLVGGDLWSRRVAGGTAKLQRAQKLKERLSALAIERERVLHERTLVIVRDAGDQLRILRGAVERPQLLEDFQDGSERKARLLGLVHVAAGAQHRRCAGGRGAASRGRARHVAAGEAKIAL